MTRKSIAMVVLVSGVPLFLALCAVGCAGRRARITPVDLSVPDALVRQGCFHCLRRAAQMYEEAAVREAGRGASHTGLFSASLLTALRAKELGLPSAHYIARARELVATLQTTFPAAPAMLAITEAVSPAPSALAAEDRERLASDWNRQRRRFRDEWRRALVEPTTPPLLRAYVAALLSCGERLESSRIEDDSLLGAVRDTPLVAFRVSLCRGESVEPDTPDWPEAQLFEAVRRMATRDRWWDALDTLRRVSVVFPDSPMIHLALADALRDQDPREAVREYDLVLATVPTHREALIGKTVCLTRVGEHHAAIDTATRLVDLGTWHLGSAFYWRAWNRLHLGILEDAAADAKAALALGSSSETHVLAGLIAFRRKLLAEAVAAFSRARHLDAAHCSAAEYLGEAQASSDHFALASEAFDHAVRCYESQQLEAQRLLSVVDAMLPPAVHEQEATRHRSTLENARRDAARSELAQAQSLAAAGQPEEGLKVLHRSLMHPETETRAALLRARLPGLIKR